MKAITAPVSWIGRVRYTDDSRIERIDMDPIPFAPGQAALGPDAREQVSRVAAFLGQSPEVRMALTPVVSARDRAALRQGSLDNAIERIARDERLSPDAAAARLFKERFPGEPSRDDRRCARGARSDGSHAGSGPHGARRPPPGGVRDGIKKAGIDGGRLKEVPASTARTRPRAR